MFLFIITKSDSINSNNRPILSKRTEKFKQNNTSKGRIAFFKFNIHNLHSPLLLRKLLINNPLDNIVTNEQRNTENKNHRNENWHKKMQIEVGAP